HEEAEEEEEEEEAVSLEDDPTPSAHLPSSSPSEGEKNIRASVRAVSLALASTFDFGRDDIPVTQMNILLRAPRCFHHPSWLPKQALGRTLDARVDEFFSGTGQAVRKGPPEEGVLVQCSPPLQHADRSPQRPPTDQGGDDEEHDMIWWQWSAGAIRGFGDI
ncbi:hypothetical protein FRB90_005325, partial [Tulasnella sp. 427]